MSFERGRNADEFSVAIGNPVLKNIYPPATLKPKVFVVLLRLSVSEFPLHAVVSGTCPMLFIRELLLNPLLFWSFSVSEVIVSL